MLWNRFGKPLLSIADPAIAQDLFTTKNKYIDKTGIYRQQSITDSLGSEFSSIAECSMPDVPVIQTITELLVIVIGCTLTQVATMGML